MQTGLIVHLSIQADFLLWLAYPFFVPQFKGEKKHEKLVIHEPVSLSNKVKALHFYSRLHQKAVGREKFVLPNLMGLSSSNGQLFILPV